MRWYAKLSNGDVKAMTLDELDAAYENGVISSHTLVLGPDGTDWVALGELASLGDAESTRPTVVSTDSATPAGPPPRHLRLVPKWVAPVAVAAVAATAFAAAGFEAQRAGAFSPRRAPALETSPPPPATVATTDAPLLPAAVVELPRHPAPRGKERRSGRNPQQPSAGPSGSSSEQAPVFTSGGNRYDPLNSDLP